MMNALSFDFTPSNPNISKHTDIAVLANWTALIARPGRASAPTHSF